MKANYKDKIPKPEATVEMGTLYDMNKQIISQLPLATTERKDEIYHELQEWISSKPYKYYMLLCHERRDYTVFNLDKTNTYKTYPQENIKNLALDYLDCLINRGSLICAEKNKDGVWEAWIKINGECYAYFFFPYDDAVLEY